MAGIRFRTVLLQAEGREEPGAGAVRAIERDGELGGDEAEHLGQFGLGRAGLGFAAGDTGGKAQAEGEGRKMSEHGSLLRSWPVGPATMKAGTSGFMR